MASLLRPMAVSSALLLLGCSSGDANPAGGATSQPSGRKGAVNVEIYESQGQSCPLGNVHLDIGSVNSSPVAEVADGEGATITCRVAEGQSGSGDAGPPFAASGSLAQGSVSFRFANVTATASTPSATGEVVIRDPNAGGEYASQSCVFEFLATQGDQIGPGMLHVEFQCGTLASAADPAKTCAARNGYLLLEACDLK